MLRKFASTLALVLALAPVAAEAAPKTRTFDKMAGHTVYADWEYTNGTTITFASVLAASNDWVGTDGTYNDAWVALAIDRADTETGNVQMTGVAYVTGKDNFQLTVDNDLGTATLHVRNAIFQDDNSFTFFNVDIDMTWTATSEITAGKSNLNYKEPGFHQVTHFNGLFRDGVATGSIVGKGENFTTMPSTNGQLQNNKFGDHTFTTQTP